MLRCSVGTDTTCRNPREQYRVGAQIVGSVEIHPQALGSERLRAARGLWSANQVNPRRIKRGTPVIDNRVAARSRARHSAEAADSEPVEVDSFEVTHGWRSLRLEQTLAAAEDARLAIAAELRNGPMQQLAYFGYTIDVVDRKLVGGQVDRSDRAARGLYAAASHVRCEHYDGSCGGGYPVTGSPKSYRERCPGEHAKVLTSGALLR